MRLVTLIGGVTLNDHDSYENFLFPPTLIVFGLLSFSFKPMKILYSYSTTAWLQLIDHDQ